MPLRWPTYLGADIGAGHPLFVNLLSESAMDYKMELGWSADCIGGAYCHYGTVSGNVGPADATLGAPVKLEGAIGGYFTESKCNATNTRCSDAQVSWAEGAYHYTVSLKNGTQDKLIRMANSAIASGRAETQPPK